ncbi:paramyosin isoform X1 [Hydra vulgaris]|uniref:paramyosin isoform X1 n=1 Tax=Hydra vulgaris TaxID=6087 RepID=UPI0002B465C5|nr:paramyosin isoform X1 [Hydra vulgaris]
MDIQITTLQALEDECARLRKQLVKNGHIQEEVEMLKNELEKSLETHSNLQSLALAFESENRTMHEKYSAQLIEQAKMESLIYDLQHEISLKADSYSHLEKRFNKMKDIVESNDALKEQIYNLEKEKKKLFEQNEKIKDELETLKRCEENRTKKSKQLIEKLGKENTDLSLKLETYIEEMEDLDAKVVHLEKESKELRRYSSIATKMDLKGLTELEKEKEEMKIKLKKEIKRRENIENDLFKIEEEYEEFKMYAENNEAELKKKIQTLISEQRFFVESHDASDNHVASALYSKQTVIETLEEEIIKLKNQLKTMEEEHEILLEENSSLANENSELEEQLTLYKKKVSDLTNNLNKMSDTSNKVLVSSDHNTTDSENGNHNSNQDSSVEKIKKFKEELEQVQKYLEFANQKNTQLQNEAEQKQLQHDNALAILQKRNEDQEQSIIKLKELNHDYEKQLLNFQGWDIETVRRLSIDISELGQTNALITRMMNNFEVEREDYESKIKLLNSKIYNLEQQLNTLNYINENRSVNSNSIPSPETTPPVAIKNGELRDSMNNAKKLNNFIDENQDSISDRELRRISYKLADGNWSRLPHELNANSLQVAQIMNAQIHEKEKVYNLLVLWRNGNQGDRTEQLEKLEELVDSIKRKDLVSFLKEVGGVSRKKENGFRNTFKKMKKSVRR